MEDSYKMKARFAYPYQATPASSYRKMMESSTVLFPFRKTYISERMVNDVRGKTIRRDQEEISRHMKIYNDLKQNDYQSYLSSCVKSRI